MTNFNTQITELENKIEKLTTERYELFLEGVTTENEDRQEFISNRRYELFQRTMQLEIEIMDLCNLEESQTK